MKNIPYLVIGTVTAFFGWFLGDYNGLFSAVVIFVVADYITGIMSGIHAKQLSSKICFKGVIKKLCIFIMIGIANILDIYVLKEGGVLRAVVIFFFISNEGISILENMTELGVPVPKKIVTVLEQLRPKDDEEGGDGENKQE